MTTNRPDLEQSAERCARALLAGFTAQPALDPMHQLAEHLDDVAAADQGLWLALVASAATAMHAGSLLALKLHGVDTDAAQRAIAIQREAG